MNQFLYLAAAAAIGASAGPALAQPASEQPSVRVPYADLDLHSEAGRAKLQSRLDAAVRKVCRHGFAGGFYETLELRRCLRDTAAGAGRDAGAVLATADRRRLNNASLAAR